MPFLESFPNFKGLTNSMNPLNFFTSEQSPINTPPTSAEAGPGPSTAANLQVRNSASNVVSTGSPDPLGKPITSPRQTSFSDTPTPIRPSLKHTNTSISTSTSPSSSDSGDSTARRRVSGTNISIAEPEIFERRRTPKKRGPRPPSEASGMTNVSGVDSEGRMRRKKKPLDTYIIVKPPPTSAKNPLNLQIQLVVKSNRRGRSASGMSSRSNSLAGEGLISSASTSPAAQVVDLPATEESDDTSGQEIMNTPSTAPLTSPAAEKGLPASPKSSSTESDNGNGLKRSSSLRSSISTSTAATGSSAASGKRIEPMFNLAVHNVMQPTVVTDAATDVKVAKFHKRNLDISGVGILEPSEVWAPATSSSSPFAPATRTSTEDGSAPRQRPLSMVSLTSPISPILSRSDDGKNGIRTSLDLKGFKFQSKPDGQESKTRQFFGRVFKKKTSMGDLGAGRKKTSPSASFSSFDAPQTAISPSQEFAGSDTLHPNMAVAKLATPSNGDIATAGVGAPTFGTAPLVIRRRSSGAMITADGAVTGLSSHVDHEPTAIQMERCQSLPIIPTNRPIGYTWTVKKWAKKNEEGWAAHLLAAANAGLEIVGGSASTEDQSEVVFEWVKLKVPSNAAGDEILRRYSTTGAISNSRARSKTRPASIAPSTINAGVTNLNSPNQSRTSLTLQLPKGKDGSSPYPPSSPNPNHFSSNQNSPLNSPRLDGRPEPVRRISSSLSPSRRPSSTNVDLNNNSNVDIETASTLQGEASADEGMDSDPEDSETPWTCSVWVKKTGQRQLLGTLTPAPHHPKVVGILKIAQSLDAVSLTDVQPKFGQQNKEAAMKRVKDNVALSEENLKDVVCVTAMWLVAREEFNGLGKKKGRRGTQG
ncbi:uncharacterized protein IL334_002013 [Kwoniella shivajii]|uniref:Uncharacterized protein n=1 Tax=Kwoniella shivajii TaxID=564305 RepID=A0ABZ1CTS5_9TREE|nr:hypothetical protein IL334_002013 [Kwoniella shivajii]